MPATDRPAVPAIDELEALDLEAFKRAVAPLFEGADGFLTRLAHAGPWASEGAFFESARLTALSLDEQDQVELLDAHPRLGAPPGSVSALSFIEQGYDREAADAAAETERRRVDAELARLNDAYERRFGFRYCVFVAGRPRAALLDEFQAALANDRDDERVRGLIDVVRIGRDRYRKLRAQEDR